MTRARWLVVVLVAIWCVAVVRRYGSTQPAVAAPVTPRDAGAAIDAAPVDAAIALGPASAVEDTVHDQVWAAQLMVSPDGAQLFVPLSSADGARGRPNLAFEIWNRAGKVIRQLAIQELSDDSAAEPPPAARDAQLHEREHQAAALLDQLTHAGFSAEPFVAIESDRTWGQDTRAKLVVEGEATPRLTIDLSVTGTLTVKPRGHAAVTRHDASWRGKPTAAQQRRLQREWDAGRDGCYNAAFLEGAEVDLGHRLAYVTIGYHGSDTCWEGDASRVLVTW